VARTEAQERQRVTDSLREQLDGAAAASAKMSERLLAEARKSYLAEIASLKKVLDKVELHISCLSCSKIYSESLMLICGHNICVEVSTTLLYLQSFPLFLVHAKAL
jgi:hypothetical protein